MTVEQGFTTPEPKEALIKQRAMEHTKEAYVLVDSSKFGEISTVTFSQMDRGIVLTDAIPKMFASCKNVKEVE